MLIQENSNFVKNCILTSYCWHWDGTSIVFFDGRLSLLDRGFRYGQHLFETIAVRNGSPLLVEQHCKLLDEAAKRNNFPFPPSWKKGMRDFLDRLPFQNPPLSDGLIRIYLTAGEGKVDDPVKQPQLFVLWESAQFPTVAELKHGIKLTRIRTGFDVTAWGEKNGNYWNHLRALEEARSKGAAEGLIYDSCGFIVSAIMADLLLWVKRSDKESDIELVASAHPHARHGAVFRWVLKHQYPRDLYNERLTDSFLDHVVAMAITNSRLGVMPVTSLNGEKFSQQQLAEVLAFEYLQAHGLPICTC